MVCDDWIWGTYWGSTWPVTLDLVNSVARIAEPRIHHVSGHIIQDHRGVHFILVHLLWNAAAEQMRR
jgi:hypothetical protein